MFFCFIPFRNNKEDGHGPSSSAGARSVLCDLHVAPWQQTRQIPGWMPSDRRVDSHGAFGDPRRRRTGLSALGEEVEIVLVLAHRFPSPFQ